MPTATMSGARPSPSHRVTVSLTDEQHRGLREIAQRNHVSIAWVVREAVSRLLREDMPLLHVGRE